MPFKSDNIAYFAGLFEGEGTVFVAKYYWNKEGIKKIRKTFQVKIRIGMTDIEPLERLLKTIGGRINGPYSYHDYKSFWVWDLDSPKDIKIIIPLILEYLSPRRRKQLEVCL